MPHGTTISSDVYVAALERLETQLYHIRPHRQKQDVFMKMPSHISHKITGEIQNLGWTSLRHPLYSSDMAPCDYHLFGKLKESLCRMRFEDDDSLLNSGSDVSVQTSTMQVYRP